MQDKGLDFKHKEVVNIKDGKRLGYVQDVCADLETGMITSIMVARKRIDIISLNLREFTRKITMLQKRIKKGANYTWKRNYK
ncbi:MAG: hypothetical protein HFJ59_00575 [Clostridia bacterium]|nr:hypothetical protein [Clostridia bacterium]